MWRSAAIEHGLRQRPQFQCRNLVCGVVLTSSSVVSEMKCTLNTLVSTHLRMRFHASSALFHAASTLERASNHGMRASGAIWLAVDTDRKVAPNADVVLPLSLDVLWIFRCVLQPWGI